LIASLILHTRAEEFIGASVPGAQLYLPGLSGQALASADGDKRMAAKVIRLLIINSSVAGVRL
jgi:hypothetical protein